jgi:DNA-binding beta-propeller fold protein YncE
MRLSAVVLVSLALTACGGKKAGPPPSCKNSGDICTVAGAGTEGFLGDNGPAWEAYLSYPMDMAIGPDKLLYIVDWNNHRIRRVDAQGNIHTIAGTGEIGDTTGLEDASSFNHPTAIAFDPEGNVLIAAWHNSRLKKLDITTGALTNFAGSGKRWYSGDGAAAATADLDLPASLALTPDGSIIFVDQANQLIRKIDAAGNISHIAGQCIIGKPADSNDMPMPCPQGAGIQPNQKQVYASVLAANPAVCTNYTACAAAFAGDGGPAMQARLGEPVGQAAIPGGRLYLEASGNIVFADTANNRVRKLDTSGNISTIAGNGTTTYAAADEGQPATSVGLSEPVDIDEDSAGNIYLSDVKHSCIRKIDTDGKITTFAGRCGNSGYSGDGATATAAELNNPFGVSVDPAGNVYIADTQNNVIRMVKK